jgi:hypothetical protein
MTMELISRKLKTKNKDSSDILTMLQVPLEPWLYTSKAHFQQIPLMERRDLTKQVTEYSRAGAFRSNVPHYSTNQSYSFQTLSSIDLGWKLQAQKTIRFAVK